MDLVMQGPGKNALGTAMMRTIREGLAKAGGEPILLTGAGDVFSAGLNLKEVAALDQDGMAAFLAELEETVSALYQYPGPTVAWVNGHAIAGGCVLNLCCDWRVASDNPNIKIGINEVALGVRLPPRTFTIVHSRLPKGTEVAVLLGAGLYSPEQAKAKGLLDEVSPDAEAAARAMLESLAKLPRRAYADTKADLRGASPRNLCPDDAWKRRMDEMLPVWASQEIKDKLLAALKRA
jgi:enoyl-CoA hydratase